MKTREILTHPAHFDTILSPLFVTWNKEGDLRGCIGTFNEDGKLGETLAQYSLIAAVRDTRFDPISASELPSLSCEISLLSNFEEIQDALDWQIGTHGIEIEFKANMANREIFRGTFLPSVAPDQGWKTQTETLEHLCRKAGYRGGFESVRNNFTKIRRYQSVKFGMSFAEYEGYLATNTQ